MPAPVATAPLTEQVASFPSVAATPSPVPAQLDFEGPLRGRVMQVGDYLVGEAPDPRLSGHPGIRY
ncbi:hypothetical protein LJ737_01510 [Hymenobacter sp. 15J16-1T3B]|uniref:hypothetical protein n=1 Tax=Hymenobacter sp. 15J16-1T3B TaxID=2886941 RepID=UPI001D127B94|nr:hypothetical protein [Hymenobacter sp. 15J16-1T3B]MCC3155895.1 hypothetical protein [Hymenobacter sp. 15J16-1T3B]